MYSKILIVYPRGLKTGGPEALHQLVDALRTQGQSAFLVPAPGTEHLPRVPEFANYDAPESAWTDQPGQAVVVPETYAVLLPRIEQADRYLWWLSIDNSPLFRFARQRETLFPAERCRDFNGRVLTAKTALIQARSRIRVRRDVLTSTFHLTQSHYAWSFLHARLGVVGSSLSDYTPPRFFGATPGPEGRSLRIAYNPAKSERLMQELDRRTPWEFIPLRGMTSDEVANALTDCLVYIDLGTHPGKDRMPREAAARGAIVLALRRGSAANAVDMPIPWEHKVDVSGDVVAVAAERIQAIMAEPEVAWRAQADYRAGIVDEQRVFFEEASDIFLRGRRGSDGVRVGSR